MHGLHSQCCVSMLQKVLTKTEIVIVAYANVTLCKLQNKFDANVLDISHQPIFVTDVNCTSTRTLRVFKSIRASYAALPEWVYVSLHS